MTCLLRVRAWAALASLSFAAACDAQLASDLSEAQANEVLVARPG